MAVKEKTIPIQLIHVSLSLKTSNPSITESPTIPILLMPNTADPSMGMFSSVFELSASIKNHIDP